MQGSLQQWLGNLIRIDEVIADSSDSTLTVKVQLHRARAPRQSRTASFTQKVRA